MIGLRIAEVRKKRGITQAELAEKCGLTQPMIAKYEGGYPISNANLRSLAKVLGTTIEELRKIEKNKPDINFDPDEFRRMIKEINSYPDDDKAAILAILNGYSHNYKFKQAYHDGFKLIK